MLSISTYRKNILKTLRVKPAKMGLKQVSRNTVRTNLVQATVGLKTTTGHLMAALTPYLLGAQFTPTMRQDALVAYGNVSYPLLVLARILKVKTPTATKKAKLSGTRAAALLQLDALATHLLSVVEEGTFMGPQSKIIKKMVVLPAKGGKKEQRPVVVVDAEAESLFEQARQTTMRTLLTQYVDLYWRLSFDLFQTPPAQAFTIRMTRLMAQYPTTIFVTDTAKQPVGASQ